MGIFLTNMIPENRSKEKPPLIAWGLFKGFLLSPEQYEAMIELLEDIEDLQDAFQAEVEYEAGRGRPFAEYDAERKARIGV